jgi:tartrate dehydrogenase/decarboxylase / D-malate dehydrogenase
MLDHLGEKEASARLMRAIERVTASGLATPDLGGRATTREVTASVCDALRSANS